PFHTIGDQVEEALTLHYEERGRAAKARCLEVFGQVGFPDPQRAAESYPFELSGGLRQRAMIAMAMICRPAILIADEPTTALDVSTQALILDLMNQLREEVGLSVLLITHDLGVVANAAQYVTVMSNGRVMEAGRVADILADPRHPYTRRLIDAAPKIEGALAHGERARPTTAGPAPQPKPGRDLIFAAHNVAKTYEARKGGLWSPPQKIYALRGVDLEIPRNRTVALVGESGSGKSTLAKILLRAEIADPGGKLVYDPGDGPQDVSTLDGDALAAFRRQVQIVFQDPYASLSPRMTVQDILMEPLLIHNVGTRAERLTKVKALIQRVGLPVDTLARYPHAFSGGQRQRISIARALALDPKLLLCDEPTSALDVSVQAQVLDLLEELRDQFGLSYLFVSHDLAVVARLADEIAVMCRGAIVEQAPARRLFEAPQHPYTQSLIAAAPEPDPDRRLDLAKIAAGAGAQPEKWPKPFGYEREAPAPICEIAPRHFVRRHDAEPVSKAYSAAAE
ncbi:MAG: ABC transporter ATP-binding protein, partial [Pseudomonadota bacterium]